MINIEITHEMMQQIITYATVVIAVLAFTLSMWQFLALRNHNRLSVKPLLTYETLSVRTDRGFGIYLLNNGVGPAIVKQFKIFVNGDEIVAEPNEIWLEAAKHLNINFTFVQLNSICIDTPVAIGTRYPLLTVDEDIDEEMEKVFKDALPKINIEVQYESVYRQKYVSMLRTA